MEESIIQKLLKQRKTLVEECDSSADEVWESMEALDRCKKEEANKILNQCISVSKSGLKRAFHMLRHKEAQKLHKPKLQTDRSYLAIRKRCSTSYRPTEISSWNTPTYVSKWMRNCILKRDYNAVTRLLLLLMTERPYYFPYIKQVAFFNLLANPADHDGELLKYFCQMLMTNSKLSH